MNFKMLTFFRAKVTCSFFLLYNLHLRIVSMFGQISGPVLRAWSEWRIRELRALFSWVRKSITNVWVGVATCIGKCCESNSEIRKCMKWHLYSDIVICNILPNRQAASALWVKLSLRNMAYTTATAKGWTPSPSSPRHASFDKYSPLTICFIRKRHHQMAVLAGHKVQCKRG